nr:sigma 54-interacting transcriptional regulator [Myxococcus sp. MH1]
MARDVSTLGPSEGSLEAGDFARARTPGLVGVYGAGAALAVALPLRGESLEVGRGTPSLGETEDPRMSRRHARIRFDGQRFWVTDLGSQNGTFVDGERLPVGAPREARRVIRMGTSLFVPSADVGPLERLGVERIDGFLRGPSFRAVLDEVSRTARLGTSLHLHGESGTGKEGVARAFHSSGPRSTGPFIAVNCAAIPQAIAERLLFGARRGAYSGAEADAQGYLQSADGGTLFLDEVVELDLAVQAKLLRVLETGEVLALGAARPAKVDVRVCSASHQSLRALVAKGRLREDLYFRIGRPEVVLPPLRERPEELTLLLQEQVHRVEPDMGTHVSLLEACLLRPWPGNVRELLVEVRGAVQKALAEGSRRVSSVHLGSGAGTAFGDGEAGPAARELSAKAKTLEGEERARVEAALRTHSGNVSAAARELGMHRTTLRRLLERWDLPSSEREEDGKPGEK